MKILQINKFFHLKGGAERYMFSVSEVLKTKGHHLAFFSMEHPSNATSEWNKYFVKNVEYNREHSPLEQIGIFKNTLYSNEARVKLSRLLENFKPDITHLHNFNHQLTPSILSALKKNNVPVVMTLHDYKLVCPSYLMLNHGNVCELCKGQRFYQCFKTKCFKDSFKKSLLLTLESYLHHRILNSYKFINYFFCPSEFIMHKVQEMGLPGNFIYLSNFVDIESLKPAQMRSSNKLVYWGRFSHEKGIYTLIEAVRKLPVELELIGEGPLKTAVEGKVREKGIKNIKLLRHIEGEALFNKIKESTIAIIPSEWYENNPVSVLEAFALGMPVIGARIGGIPELVKDGHTGLLFKPGDPEDLEDKIRQLLVEPNKTIQMGRNGRDLVEKKCNIRLHYERLMEIYQKAIFLHKVRPTTNGIKNNLCL